MSKRTIVFVLFFISLTSYLCSQMTRNEFWQYAQEVDQNSTIEKQEATKIAREKGWDIRKVFENGTVIELQKLAPNGMPIYYITGNLNAARTIETDELWEGGSSDLNLDGDGFLIGEWDAGAVRFSHREFDDDTGNSRVAQQDTATVFHSHATHVAGTLIAAGIDPNAKGMAHAADLDCYDWNNDYVEMAVAVVGGLNISNHSYGVRCGWWWNSDNQTWYWLGDIDISTTEDYWFGYYSAEAHDWDAMANVLSKYLIVKCAMNDRNDDFNGNHFFWDPDSLGWELSNDPRDPDGDYDCIVPVSTAKNILTVGAVHDIPGGYTQPADVVMTNFSNWGPCDDGRIKPDLVANGFQLWSATDTGDADYEFKSGTSMSSPSVTGSLALLQDHYHDLHDFSMKSSTLKGLAINTADEAGTSNGPDYSFGWGLFNAKKAAELIEEDYNSDGLIEEYTLNDGATESYIYYSDGTEKINVTVCWLDPPGTSPAPTLDPADPMLVNDLDLVLKDTSDNWYYPWKLNKDNPPAAATNNSENNIDNVETVTIETPNAGYYHIIIDHDGMLAYDQNYSLIVSGMQKVNSAIWEGLYSSNWHNESNWNIKYVPDENLEVSIPAGTTFVPAIYENDAICKRLSIASGTALDFVGEGDLDVLGSIINQGNINVPYDGDNYIRCHGDFFNYGDFSAGHSTIELNGDGTQELITNFQNFYLFSIGANSETDVLFDDLNIENQLTIYGELNIGQELLTINTYNLSIQDGGSLILNDGILNVEMTTGVIGPTGLIDLTHNNSEANFHGLLNGGTIDCGVDFTPELHITSAWVNTGSFVPGNSKCYLEGSLPQGINVTEFYDLYINMDSESDKTNIISSEKTNKRSSAIENIYNSSNPDNRNFEVSLLDNISVHDLHIQNGVLNSNDHMIEISGNWSNSVGDDGFLEENGTVIFNGDTGHQYCSNETFSTLEINKPSAAFRINGTTVTCESYDWTSGALDVLTGTFTANDLIDDGIYGNYILHPDGTINLHQDGSSLIDLNGSLNISGGTVNVYGGNATSYWSYGADASISMSGGILDFHDKGINISASYTLTEDITGGTIRTAYGFTGNRSDFTPTGGTIEMYSSADADMSMGTGSNFYNVEINKSSKAKSVNSKSKEYVIVQNRDGTTTRYSRANTVNAISNLDINGDFTIESGVFDPNDSTMYVGGDWTNNAGIGHFHESTSRVIFNGSSHQYVYSDETFNILEVNCGEALRVNDTTYTVTCNTYDWTSGGIDVLAGTFTALDLEDDRIFGGYWLNPGGTINLYQDGSSYVDLNGSLNISGGTMNVYGGSMTSAWPYSADAEINMEGGILDFHDKGIYIYNSASYTLTEDITGGTIRTAYGFTGNRSDFTPTGGTIEMYGSTDAIMSMGTGSNFYNVEINKSSKAKSVNSKSKEYVIVQNRDGTTTRYARAETVTGTSNLDINGDFIIDNGIFTAPDTMWAGSDWTNNVGSAGFVEGTGIVIFDGNYYTDITTDETFYNLAVDKTLFNYNGTEIMVGLTINVLNDLNILDGTLEMNTGSTLDIDNDLDIAMDAGLNAFNDTGLNIFVGGNWDNGNNTFDLQKGFYSGNSTVTFDGDYDQILTTNCSKENFYNLIIDKSGGEFRSSDNTEIFCNLTIANGNWRDNIPALEHTIYGDFTVANSAGWSGTTNNTVIFKGTIDQDISFDPSTDGYFYNVIIDKTAKAVKNSQPEADPSDIPAGEELEIKSNTKKKEGSKSQTVNLLTDCISLNFGYLIVDEGTLELNGNYYRCTGNVTINDGGKIAIDDNAWLEVGDGYALNVNNGGELELIGSAGNEAKLTVHNPGYYDVEIESGGTISAEYAIFEYTSANGVQVKDGAIIDPSHPFDNCIFRYGSSGGTLLTINNDQILTVNYADFPTNTWSGANNVTKSINHGEITFFEATGDFAGEAYEDDPFNRIHWTTTGQPDLTITNTEWSDTNPYVCDTINVEVTVKNIGDADVSSIFYLDLYYNETSPPGIDDLGDQFQDFAGLSAGDSLIVNFYTISNNVAEVWSSYAQVDADSNITESEEGNNVWGPDAITWNALPLVTDLVINYNSGTGDIELDWTYSTTADSFFIYRDTNPYFTPDTPHATVAGATTTWSETATANKYFYIVTAYRDDSPVIIMNNSHNPIKKFRK